MIFTVAVFFILCLEILKASEKAAMDIRISVGAAFYIRAKTEVVMDEDGEIQIREDKAFLTQTEIEEIMREGEIQYYNPVNYGFAKSDAIQFIQGDKHTEKNNMGKVTALRFSALAADFIEETSVLTEGKHITGNDYGKILVSEPLARTNGLAVGDRLILTHARLGEKDGEYIDEIPHKTAYTEVEVAGIYRLKNDDTSLKPTAGVPANEIYASLDVLNELQESEEGIYTGEVDFYITDPAKLKDITDNILQLQSIDWTTHFIRTNDFQYSKFSDRLSSIGDLGKILLVLISLGSTVFLTLLLTMRMHGRMRETGILLSLGVTKGNILAGFLWEMLSLGIPALLCSYIVSQCITGWIENSLFGTLYPNLLNEETILGGMQSKLRMDNYLKLGYIKILFLYYCQLAVMAVSTLLSSGSLMRLKPKEILLKMS